MSKMTETEMDKFCSFLKFLYELCKDEPTCINISVEAGKMGIPYRNNLPSTLVRVGIMARYSSRNGHLYRWISTTEPNRIMAEKLILKMRDVSYKNNAKHYATPIAPQALVATSDPFNAVKIARNAIGKTVYGIVIVGRLTSIVKGDIIEITITENQTGFLLRTTQGIKYLSFNIAQKVEDLVETMYETFEVPEEVEVKNFDV